MTSLFRTTPVVAFAFSFGNYAHAHPGHAHEIVPSAEYWHYVVQPEHALVLLVAVATAVGLLSLIGRCKRRELSPVAVRRER